MNFKLEREHLLGMDCAALEALGREHVEQTRKLLEAEAAKLDPVRSWRDQITEAKKRHPEALRLREAYESEVARARAFVAEHGMMSIREGAKLEIMDTTLFRPP